MAFEWSDFFSAVPIVGDIVNYFSNQATNTANSQAVADTNATNLKIAQETNAMNQAINEQNIALTREQNQINRDREDNAVRRRVNDLVGAGLSKTLAAGSPASANAMQAPQATQGMSTGHAMQSAKFSPYKSENLATVGRLAQENVLANKELELKNKELDVRLQELDELSRHNKASEEELYRHNFASESESSRHNKVSENTAYKAVEVDERYLGYQDKWNQMAHDQSDAFHKDAVRLEDAKNQISYLQYLSQDNQREMQNLWYQSEIDFMDVTTEQNAMRLTADLAESSAKVASYYADINLTAAQLDYVRSQIPYVAAITAEALARKENLDQDTKNMLVDYIIKEWNLSVAKDEGTTTTSSIPGKTDVEQLKKSRIASYVTKGVSTGLSVGAGIFLGSGGGKFINKMLGMDHHNPMGFHM